MAAPATGHAETATHLPSSPPPPPAPAPLAHPRSLSSVTTACAQDPATLVSAHASTVSPRAPNPAKRVLRNPTDELRSAVNRDALRSEAKRAAENNQARPALAASPPASPTTTPSTSPVHFDRVEPRSTMPRNPSIDSTVSTTSHNSAKLNGSATYRSTDAARKDDVDGLIADAGSPEAAILKLIGDRNQAASHNAQLWRLVEKQRTMILGLNKDLEKALKEKEKYRKRARDQLVQSESAPALTTANQQLQDLLVRQGSQSPNVRHAPVSIAPSSTRDTDSRKVSDTSDALSYRPGRSDTPLDASNAPSSALPATPQSTGSATQLLRDIQIAEAAATSAQENRVGTQSPSTSPIVAQSAASPRTPNAMHHKHPSISSVASNTTPTASFSAAKNLRKAPPAPLNLSLQKEAEAAAQVTNNIIDPSDSDYDDDPESARVEQSARGRRKTREEDDRDRELAAEQELASRSRSMKNRQEKLVQAVHDRTAPSNANVSITADTARGRTDGTLAADDALLPLSDAAPVVRRQIVAHGPPSLPKSSTAPSLMSPGLPMSPRPGDRPLNSPMPRAPNKSLNSIPMSPKAGMAGLPLSPRAPRHPIPMPPQMSSNLSAAPIIRAEEYQNVQPLSNVVSQGAKPTPASLAASERERPVGSIDGAPTSPGEIYQGLVTDDYPDLLLPPNALPSIYIKTASSRMKPSRQSYLAPKTADDNPVFTLAVYERSSKRQLWRVEKAFVALAQLDEEVKAVCRFRERMPDKTLFNGHAPARIDARRAAIDAYFDRMLDAVTDDRTGMVICSFLSTDAFGTDGNDYFGGSVDLGADASLSQKPRREGYLTKRGKNFGGWKARYFVLDGPMFKYYDTQGGAQLGSIKLAHAQIGKQSNSNTPAFQEDEDNQYRHAFLILEPKKKDSTSLVRHVLCAESDEERDIWVETLLQHVDYREEPEEAVVRQLLSAKTNMMPPRSPRLQKSLNDLRPPSRSRENGNGHQDQLRGLGYNDMVAGDAPVIGLAPQHPRAGERSASPHDGNFGPATSSSEQSSPHPTISGPTNLHVISNAGEWGMKQHPPPPGQSKDKKRGIFSGLRGRSSSDLGPSEKPASSSLTFNEQGNGLPVRAAFGAPLADAVDIARPFGVVTDLPAVVYRCIEYLLAKNALAEEGIFRLSGSNTVVKGLRDRFNSEGDVNLVAEDTYYDIHAVASLLKLYLRELPSSILTRELHLEFLACAEKQGTEKTWALNPLVNRLPRVNRALLEALSSLLLGIVNNADVNKMNIRNVGIVFSPTLNVPGPLISAFVEDHDIIFGPPIEALESNASTVADHPQALPTDLRSPRKQMFSDLPTPAYHQTTFQSFGAMSNDDTGMIPVNPTYYQVAPQREGGFGSINDALHTPSAYNVAASGIPSSRDQPKARRRESAMLGFPMSNAMQKKTSRSQLREEF